MTTRTQHKHSVIIIGGGIAGLTAAVSLARCQFLQYNCWNVRAAFDSVSLWRGDSVR